MIEQNIRDYIKAGYKVFPLHKTVCGFCGCGNMECKATYKHPLSSNWQYTPDWSEEQLQVMLDIGQFETGFGVLCKGSLIIDIDPRNGGDESYARLVKDTGIDFEEESSLVVRTGGGGRHIYFKADEEKSYLGKLQDYAGIDFKSSGFVVGLGSSHASGNTYQLEKGSLSAPKCDIPPKLLALLERKGKIRKEFNGKTYDIDEQEVEKLLEYVPVALADEYESMIEIGMAIHESLHGGGLEIWDKWCSQSDKYDGYDAKARKWHSFGKSQSVVGLGTLIYHAENNGYLPPVTFEYIEDTPIVGVGGENDSGAGGTGVIDTSYVDLNKPCGIVGEVTDWINQQSLYPRERLAVGAALMSVGSLCGLRYTDHLNSSTNILAFGVAGSSTGKESILQSVSDVMEAGGMHKNILGNIKSEQELIRNLCSQQANIYSVDEFGYLLSKIVNAKGSGASYLEGVISTIMSIYSKANGKLHLGGDVKKEVTKQLLAVMKSYEDDGNTSTAESIKKNIEMLSSGLVNPFLSLIGFTTPTVFDELIDFEQATNGFIARAFMFIEEDTNPRINKHRNVHPVPLGLAVRLRKLAVDVKDGDRVTNRTVIETTKGGLELLDRISDEFWNQAETYANTNGYESLVRRGYEQVLKLSLILASGEGIRTEEHITWAYAFVLRDIKIKTIKVVSNDKEGAGSGGRDKLARAIAIIGDDGATFGKIRNRMRMSKDECTKLLAEMVTREIIKEDKTVSKNNKATLRYFVV
jgi:hypothetical protein